jgi:DNA-binding CsgD family transcriptional regulator
VAAVTIRGADAAASERRRAGLERLCFEGRDLTSFRTEALRRVRSLVSVDAAFFATVDPVTVLFTSAVAEEPLAQATPLFLDNEFGREDVNKFARLATSADPVGSLDVATRGERAASARFREVLEPLGLGDEVRMALVADDRCWGVLCLHRSRSALGFDADEMALLTRVAPLLGRGLRQSIALFPTDPDPGPPEGPGIIVLGPDLAVISINRQAETWLADIAEGDWPTHLPLPFPVMAVAAQVSGPSPDESARPTRLRRARGGWLTVRASTLDGPGGPQVAVVLDAADADLVSSLALAAHGLTPAQGRVAALVVQGRSTRSIVSELGISANTVQEHLHAVFDKFGIGSRRELVAALSGRPH